MTASRDHLRAVTSWLNDLNNITAGSMPLADGKARIASLAAALSEEYPPPAFTRQSLLAVAKTTTFLPSYAEICAVLCPWWNERRPKLPAIATSDERKEERERATAEASWKNITDDEIRAKVRAIGGNLILGHFLATAVNRHAPLKLGLLPPAWIKDFVEPPEVAELRRPAAAAIKPEVRRGPPLP